MPHPHRNAKGLTFRAPPDPTANPHPRVEMQIPLVPRLHAHVDAERIRLRIDLVRLGGIHELFEDVAGADAPAFGFDGDVGGGVVVGLEEVVGGKVGGEVGGDELGVLSAGLGVGGGLVVGGGKEMRWGRGL